MITWVKKVFFSDKKIKRLLWAALILSIVISGWRTLTFYAQDMSVFVRVSMKSPETGSAELYYDVGRQFNSRDFSSAYVYGDGKFHDVKLKIPFTKILYNLRLDPPRVSEGEIIVNKIDVIDRYGRILYDLDLNRLKPANQIQKFDFIDGNVHFSIDEKANDPQIRILMDRPISFNPVPLLALMLTHRVMPEFIVLFLMFVLLIYVWSRWTDPVITAMVLLAILTAGWMAYHDFASVYYRFTMKSAVQGDKAALYYDQGYGLSEESVERVHIQGDDLYHDYNFKIPRNISHLRFDPLTKAGTVVIKKMAITDRYGNVLKSFSLRQLSPANQIKKFEFSGEELIVITEDKAQDPQISVMFDEAWFQQSHSHSLLLTVVIVLIEWFLISTILLLSIYIWRKKKEGICNIIDGAFVQDRLPVIYLGCALGLMLTLAFISCRNCYPDEWMHILCANYYSDFWLPKSVDNPEILKTVNGWGMSYLFRPEIAYLLAGKAALLLSGLINDYYLRVRLFNVALFLFLVLIAAHKIRKAPFLFLILVASPQIWFVFSHFNSDAFGLFVTLLLAWQITYPDSLTHQYLNSANLRDKIYGGILFGTLLGLIPLLKLNYFIYIAFILFIITWHFISQRKYSKSDRNSLQIKKGVLIACVALCICLPPMVYDQYVNDFQKDEKIMIVNERYADPPFRPSTMQRDMSSTHPGIFLKAKGVTLQELFLGNPEWRDMSFKSFFGLYGNMDIHSDKEYYRAVTYVSGFFFLLVFFYIVLTFPSRDMIFVLFVFLFVGLAIGQSVYTSWMHDYEPQGRYLFVILPMLMVGLAKLPASFHTRVMPLFGLVFFILSGWSFLLTAIKVISKIP